MIQDTILKHNDMGNIGMGNNDMEKIGLETSWELYIWEDHDLGKILKQHDMEHVCLKTP